MVGWTLQSTKAHLARAIYEAIGYQSKEVSFISFYLQILLAMKRDANIDLTCLKVDGGLTNSDNFLQIQSDILGITVKKPRVNEATALGAAFAAGLATKLWTMDDLNRFEQNGQTFHSNLPAEGFAIFFSHWAVECAKNFERWCEAVSMSISWGSHTKLSSDKALHQNKGHCV